MCVEVYLCGQVCDEDGDFAHKNGGIEEDVWELAVSKSSKLGRFKKVRRTRDMEMKTYQVQAMSSTHLQLSMPFHK